MSTIETNAPCFQCLIECVQSQFLEKFSTSPLRIFTFSTTQEWDNVTTPYPISILLAATWSLTEG